MFMMTRGWRETDTVAATPESAITFWSVSSGGGRGPGLGGRGGLHLHVHVHG